MRQQSNITPLRKIQHIIRLQSNFAELHKVIPTSGASELPHGLSLQIL